MGKASFVRSSLEGHGTHMALQEEETGKTGYFTNKLHEKRG
jgi:hypothetical protein